MRIQLHNQCMNKHQLSKIHNYSAYKVYSFHWKHQIHLYMNCNSYNYTAYKLSSYYEHNLNIDYSISHIQLSMQHSSNNLLGKIGNQQHCMKRIDYRYSIHNAFNKHYNVCKKKYKANNYYQHKVDKS